MFKTALLVETEKVHKKFCSLLRDTFSKLKQKADLKEIKDYIESLLTSSDGMYNQVYNWPSEDPTDKIASFNKLRQFLQNNFCSWYNYAMISALREEFLFLPENDTTLNEYQTLFMQYVDRCCFIYLEDLGPQPQEVKTVRVTCKINVDFEEISYHQIQKLKLVFIDCLNQLSRYNLILKQVKDGCTELVFQAPTWLKSIDALEKSQVCYLLENGFIEVTIDDRKLLSQVVLCAIFTCSIAKLFLCMGKSFI